MKTFNTYDHLIYRNKNAFSLVELILTLVILGITAVIFVPRIGSVIDSIRLDNSVNKLADDIRRARHYAIDHHDTTWVVVDVSNNNYGIYKGNSPSNRELILDPLANTPTLIDFDATDYSGVSIISAQFDGSSEFYFDYWGEPSNSGTVVINSKIISISEGTGHVSITD